jgi:type 1 fimbria pilin
MRIWMRKALVVGLVAMASVPAVSVADGGTIAFSGAVVEPTCSVGAERIGDARSAATPQRYRCSERANATPGQLAQSYALSVSDTVGTSLATDPLIVYFAQYLSAQPKLVTQTYD